MPEHHVKWSKGRRISFYTAVVLSLASVAITGPVLTLPVTAWLPETALDAMFSDVQLEAIGGVIAPHRIHAVGAGLFFWLTVVAMIALIRRPERKAAPLWASAATMVVLVPLDWTQGFNLEDLTFALPVLAVLALHPRRRPEKVAWRSGPAMAGVPFAAVAAVYAFQQTLAQITGSPADSHVADGHYAVMAALAVGIGVSALLGVTDFPGQVISAWATGLAALALGTVFIGYPHLASSAGVGGGAAIVVWAIIYLAVTVRNPRVGVQDDRRIGGAS
jgi:hypothetical protein